MEDIQKNEQTTKKETVSKKSEKEKEVEKMESTVKSFKELNELSKSEIEKLPKVTIILRKREYKRSKSVGYELEVRLHEYLKKLVTGNKFTETDYYAYKVKLNLDFNFAEDSIRVPIRFVTGERKDGSTYYQMELILEDDLYYTDLWLNSNELTLLNHFYPNLKWAFRERKLENVNLGLGE